MQITSQYFSAGAFSGSWQTTVVTGRVGSNWRTRANIRRAMRAPRASAWVGSSFPQDQSTTLGRLRSRRISVSSWRMASGSSEYQRFSAITTKPVSS